MSKTGTAYCEEKHMAGVFQMKSISKKEEGLKRPRTNVCRSCQAERSKLFLICATFDFFYLEFKDQFKAVCEI